MGRVDRLLSQLRLRSKSASAVDTPPTRSEASVQEELDLETEDEVLHDDPDKSAVERGPRLPSELLRMIVWQMTARYDRDTLKSVRLIDRSLHYDATSILFHTLHLSANTLSVDRLRNIAKSPQLAKHVHRLVLHKGSWVINREELSDDNHMQILRGFTGSDESLPKWGLELRGRFVLPPLMSPTELNELNQTFIAELQGQWVPGDSWVLELRDLLSTQNFPQLEEIRIPKWTEEGLSDYHIRKTGRVQTIVLNLPFDLRTIMRIVVNARVKVLDLRDQYIDDFFSYRDGSRHFLPSTQLANIQVLRLMIRERDPTESFSFDWPHVLDRSLRGLTKFLEACAPSLEDLYFRVGPGSLSAGRRTENFRAEQVQTTRTIAQIHYPRLKVLSLDNFAIDEESFLSFLSSHKQTLKTLNLTTWIMPVPVVSPTSNSWVMTSHSSTIRALWRIPQSTSLETATLNGHFMTTNDHGLDSPCLWRAQRPDTTTSHHDCLTSPPMLSRLESYLTHQSPFPFSSTLTARLSAGAYDDLIPTFQRRLVHPSSGNGQWTWTLDAMPEVVFNEDHDSTWRFVDRRKSRAIAPGLPVDWRPALEPWSSWYRIRRE